MGLFKQGLQVQPGGVASGLASVKDTREPELHKLTGSRQMRAAQVTLDSAQLSEDSVCVLDMQGKSEQITQWVGAAASSFLKYQALTYAEQLDSANHGGDAQVGCLADVHRIFAG